MMYYVPKWPCFFDQPDHKPDPDYVQPCGDRVSEHGDDIPLPLELPHKRKVQWERERTWRTDKRDGDGGP